MSFAPQPLFGRMIPAMVSPFDDDLAVDFGRTRALVRYLLQGGCDSILVCGTTGESPTLSVDEKLELFRVVVDEVAGRVPVIANVGSNCTSDSVSFGLLARESGVSGIMAVVPYYNKPPQEGMFLHFKAIAEQVGLPTIVYNIPGRCGVNMTAETTLRLAREVENVVAVKEASGDLGQMKAIIGQAPEGFSVYAGDDSLTLAVMEAGGAGVISTLGNVCPREMKELTDLCSAGDFRAGASAHERLLPLMRGLFAATNPILVKKALNLRGICVGGVRLPLVEATQEQTSDLATLLEDVGVASPVEEA